MNLQSELLLTVKFIQDGVSICTGIRHRVLGAPVRATDVDVPIRHAKLVFECLLVSLGQGLLSRARPFDLFRRTFYEILKKLVTMFWSILRGFFCYF